MSEKLRYCWECGKQIKTGVETKHVRGPLRGRPLRFCDYQCLVIWDASFTDNNSQGAQALNLNDIFNGNNSSEF